MHPMHPRVTDGMNKRYHVPNYLPKSGATSIGFFVCLFFSDNNPVAKVMGRK